MYSPQIVNERLKRIEQSLNFEPRHYSLVEIDRNKADLKAILDDDGSLTRKLTPDEIAFIRNERAVCAADYSYYQNYTTIRGWDGRLTRYKPNIAQKILMDLRGEMELAGHSIEFLNLKARRLGVSTEAEMALAHRTQMISYTKAIVASADDEMSATLSGMLNTNWDNMPWYLMPQMTRNKAGVLFEFGYIGSSVSVQGGSQLKGIGRGDTPNIVHLSELSFYKNAEDLVEASLLRAVIPHPSVLLLLETTAAAGRWGWVYDTWRLSKENWPNTRLRPIFLPWFVGSDIYPSETWLKQHPVPMSWYPNELTVKHAEKAAAFVRSSDLLRKYLGNNWRMPKQQMWWWEFNFMEAKQKKLLAKFLSEVASDDEECWQSGNIPCFDIEVITEHRQSTKPPIDVYGFAGTEIPLKLRVLDRDVNPNKPPIDITAHWSKSSGPMDFRLIPVKWDPSQSHLGRFMVWEHPAQHEEYGVGVDSSKGVGRDRAVEQVLRKGTIERNDAQVALYSADDVNALALWPITMAISTYYSGFKDGLRRQCRLCIECSDNGETTQIEMKKRGWSNFHPWLRMAAKKIRLADSQTDGWYMMEWSRRLMMDWLINAVEDFWLDIPAASTISELETLELDSKKQKLKASYGAHDDEPIALGIILVSMHLHDVIRNNMPDRRKNSTISKEFLRYRPPLSASSIPDHMLNKRTTVADSYDSDQSFVSIAERLKLR